MTQASEILVLDGGFGSLLSKLGYDVNTSPIWSGGAILDNPDLVRRCHQIFIDAGANVITTNTYHCCSRAMVETMGLSRDGAEGVLMEAVRLAREAISNSHRAVKLVASIGPYATYLRDGSEYTGAYTKEPDFDAQTIVDYYIEQTKPLVAAGVKSIAFETVPSLVEVQCLKEVAGQLPDDVEVAWISVACKDGTSTCAGDEFSTVVETASSISKVQYVGVNCTSPLHITELLQHANCGVSVGQPLKPFVVYPNAGETYDADNKRFLGSSKVDMILKSIPEWYHLGARIFGGCCCVYPEDIRKIATLCRELSAKS